MKKLEDEVEERAIKDVKDTLASEPETQYWFGNLFRGSWPSNRDFFASWTQTYRHQNDKRFHAFPLYRKIVQEQETRFESTKEFQIDDTGDVVLVIKLFRDNPVLEFLVK